MLAIFGGKDVLTTIFCERGSYKSLEFSIFCRKSILLENSKIKLALGHLIFDKFSNGTYYFKNALTLGDSPLYYVLICLLYIYNIHIIYIH